MDCGHGRLSPTQPLVTLGSTSIGSWAIVGILVWRAIAMLHQDVRAAQAGVEIWGIDFQGGAWLAAHQILHGVSPYLAASPQLLFHHNHAFVTPPAIGLAAVPLTHLPYGMAVAIWNLADAAGMLAALWLLRVRDPRIYVLAICSAPFLDSLNSGQLEGILALMLAVAWQRRNSRAGALATGALIAVKLYAFPLVIWLIATKRFRSAAVATGSALLFLIASWAVIGFHGLAQYPSLLSATSHAAEREISSLSMSTLVLQLGGSHTVGTVLAVVFGLVVSGAIVLAARGSDDGWFAACVTVGLIASPILWEHYLVLLFRPTGDLAAESALAVDADRAVLGPVQPRLAGRPVRDHARAGRPRAAPGGHARAIGPR